MARFATMAVLLVVIMMFAIAIAEASVYKTTVTTTEIDENESTGSRQSAERCRQQMHGMQMKECQQYLEQSQRGVLMMSTGNPAGREVPEQCCREMREVSEECRCEAVRQMMQQMHGGEYQSEEMQEMMQKASRLPSMCGMRPQYCDIRGQGY